MIDYKETLIPVSVIVPMCNASTTIVSALESLIAQKYPIKEIIVIDNVSTDSSVEIVQEFKENNGEFPIRLIKHKQNMGVGGSYNEGVKVIKTNYAVFMHSDSVLPSENELRKLMEPIAKNSGIVASAPIMLHPKEIWNKYNFWQKCLFARVVDKEVSSGNGKFDCYRKDTFLLIGGYDVVNYGHNIGIGSEDADLYIRLRDVGSIVVSKAKVIHLHNLSKDYSFWSWINNRKFMGRSYGRLLRIQGRKLFGSKALLLGIKPMLVLVSFLPIFFPLSLIVLFLYGIASMNIMYRTKDTITNPRIVLLPFIAIFFIYYEVFWMLEAFLSIEKK